MKKSLLTLFAFASMVLAASAQYYYIPDNGQNPGGNINQDPEYPAGSGQAAGWSSLDPGSAATPHWTATQTLPFAFQFNGAAVTQYMVSTSGILTFNTSTTLSAPSYTKAALPNATIPSKSVCIWGLSGLGSNDAIFTKIFGVAPNRQLWIQFNSYSYGNTASDGSNFCYWAMMLEETTNKIYIVDQRSGGYSGTNSVCLGIQIDSVTATMVAGSPNYTAKATTDASPADNYYYAFMNGVQATYDIAAVDVNMQGNLILNQAPFTVNVDIRNLGTTTITSATVNWMVNGLPSGGVSKTVTGMNLASFAKMMVVGATWTPSAAGTYTIKAWLSAINGSNADQVHANDTATFIVHVWTNFVVRNVLHELFTSSTCPPCNPGNIAMDGVLAQRVGKWNTIKYQVNFPSTGDPYYTAEGGTRFSYYSSTFAPWLQIDGNSTWAGSGGPNANSYTTTLFDNFASNPSFMSITATQTQTGNTFSITGTVTPIIPIGGSQLKLRIAVVERKTVKNVKTNGETEFYNVMKKMLPDASGTAINLSAGTAVNFSQSFTFPGSYRLPADGQAASIINLATENSVEDFGDLIGIIFVQNDSSKEILQSGSSGTVFALGNNEVSQNSSKVNVFPNPSNGTTSIDFNLTTSSQVSIEVMNIVGQKVLDIKNDLLSAGDHSISFDASKLNNGVYLISVKTAEGTTSTKFIVNK